MDLTQLANLGEFIGGVAVLVTLVYLVTQIRQNTAMIRATSVQAFADSLNGVNLKVAGSVEQARVGRLAMEDRSALTEDERMCADYMCLSAFLSFDSGFLQAELGALDDQTIEMIRTKIRASFQNDYFHDWWNRNPYGFTDRLVQFVTDECHVQSVARS